MVLKFRREVLYISYKSVYILHTRAQRFLPFDENVLKLSCKALLIITNFYIRHVLNLNFIQSNTYDTNNFFNAILIVFYNDRGNQNITIRYLKIVCIILHELHT